MQSVCTRCAVYGPRRRNVVIEGATGTGKSLVALELHNQSPRRHKRLVRISASELDPDLMRSMLAGHKKGGFTGAVDDFAGLLQDAEGSSVFLDDVQDTRLASQPYLLDVIEGMAVRGIGVARPFVPDVRWIFGTQRPLATLVAEGFKRDLAARMGHAGIVLLPLCQRLEDLDQLVPHLVAKAARSEALTPPTVSLRVMDALRRHPWPDNVRELEDVLSVALIEANAEDVEAIELRHIPEAYRGVPFATDAPSRRRQRVSRDELLDALDGSNWVVARVADRLGVDRRTVFRRMLEYAIQRPSTATHRKAQRG